MSKNEVPVLTGVPDIEVIQFNCEGIFTIRDGSGKVASTQKASVAINQAQFSTTLQAIAERLVEEFKKEPARG